jgi:hypothetical protein
MRGSRPARLVAAALRCYPPRWRSRHGDEAAELAALLMRDGMPVRSIACSYFMGAARARLAPGPGRRVGVAAGTLLVAAASLGAPLALLSSSAPASAASVIRARITNRGDAAGQLESVLRSRHFHITVTQEPVSPSLVGSIIGPGIKVRSGGGAGIVSEITGPCAGGARGCVDGIVLPARFTGSARIVVGRAAKPGERYAAAADLFRPGEMLQCSALLGESVRQALTALESLHVKIAWETGDGKLVRWPVPVSRRYYIVGGTALSAGSIAIRIAAKDPAPPRPEGSHGRRC